MKKIAIVTLGVIALAGQLVFFVPEKKEATPAVEMCHIEPDFICICI
ncbi:MAG: hypothetical protein ACI4TB_06575 [Lachnospiraceae bacterium]